MIEKFENWLKLSEEKQIVNLIDILKTFLTTGNYTEENIRDIIKTMTHQQRKLMYASMYNLVWNLESLGKQIKTFREQIFRQLLKFEDIVAISHQADESTESESFATAFHSRRLLFQEVGKELSDSKERLFQLIDGKRTIADLAETLEVTPSYISQVISEWEEEGLIVKERRGRKVIPVKSPKYQLSSEKNAIKDELTDKPELNEEEITDGKNAE